ncbi:hypothetical protein DLREEDagrD3_27920 [Denitratisoma sp. agr-D3]
MAMTAKQWGGYVLALALGPCLYQTAWADCPVPLINTPTAAAQKLAVHDLNTIAKCDSSDPKLDQSPCNIFVSRGIKMLYGVEDFQTGSGHMDANRILKFVSTSPKWGRIGSVNDSDNGLCAQATANAGLPVIAIKSGTVHGHVVMVIPGQPEKSLSFGVIVPKAAGFFLVEPDNPPKDKPRFFIGGQLSEGFGAEDFKKSTYYYRKAAN